MSHTEIHIPHVTQQSLAVFVLHRHKFS